MSRGAQRRLESAATAAIVEALRASHGPRILRLTLLQQVILKTLSLLVAPTRTSTLLHALPVALDERGLELQMHALCESGEGLLRATVASRVEEGDDDDDEGSSCRHFDLYCGGAKEEAAYVFASAGLREVCQSMLLDAHKRQVRFRLVTQYESNSVLARLLCPLDDSFIPLTKHDDLLGAIREGPGTMQSAEGEVTASSMADDPYLTSGGGSLGELSQSVPGGLAVGGGGGAAAAESVAVAKERGAQQPLPLASFAEPSHEWHRGVGCFRWWRGGGLRQRAFAPRRLTAHAVGAGRRRRRSRKPPHHKVWGQDARGRGAHLCEPAPPQRACRSLSQ